MTGWAFVMAKETRLEMAIRHLAQQEARIAKQRALIAQMSDHGLPITDATNLLAAMERLRRQIRDELDGLTNKPPRDR
jgi:hypothetical protein